MPAPAPRPRRLRRFRTGEDLIAYFVVRARLLSMRLQFHPWTAQSLPVIVARLADYARLMRLDRPIGMWLLLWPTLWGLWMSSAGKPNPRVFLIFVTGVVLMRAAGCVINDYADRGFDSYVARTQARPLAAGRISTAEALLLFAALSLTALYLALKLPSLAVLLAAVGGALAVTYPFTKRFFSLPQFYLGVAFGWGIPMAFAAHTDGVPRLGWLLFLANVIWAAVYDTQYAMVDRDDDLKIGVRSTAILFGDADRHLIGILQLMTLLALYFAGRSAHLGGWYLGGLGAGALFFAYHQWLIRHRDRDACFKAFLNNHYFGMCVFIGMALDYLFR
jgi:4-hydroxybenzoate polyprenyltransferase